MKAGATVRFETGRERGVGKVLSVAHNVVEVQPIRFEELRQTFWGTQWSPVKVAESRHYWARQCEEVETV